MDVNKRWLISTLPIDHQSKRALTEAYVALVYRMCLQDQRHAHSIDVGACRGMHTNKLLCYGNVLSIEPNKELLDFSLRQNLISKKDIHLGFNHIISNAILSDVPGTCTFEIDKTNPEASKITSLAGSQPTTTLDLVCANLNYNNVDFIKIDAEGHDLRILYGAVNVIHHSTPTVVFERVNERRDDQAFLNFWLTMGYQLFSMEGHPLLTATDFIGVGQITAVKRLDHLYRLFDAWSNKCVAESLHRYIQNNHNNHNNQIA